MKHIIDRLSEKNPEIQKLMERTVDLEKEVKQHQILEKDLVNKNCSMAGRIAGLESELEKHTECKLDSVWKDEIDDLKQKLNDREQEIAQHTKLASELTKEKTPGKQNEVSSLKKTNSFSGKGM